MSSEICNLEPALVWRNFYELTQIPRPSKHEAKVRQYLIDFGKKLGLESGVDEAGNIIIRKKATAGYENRKGIILQGHIDMVPQSDAPFDFLKRGIDAIIDGEWVKARGTTLGADNGIGVAAALSVLQSADIAHGPIEALFTFDEETSMAGALAIKRGILKGSTLINLDTEAENEISIGCAGGVDVTFEWSFEREKVDNDTTFVKISITGLRGGHSGLDIHCGRGNACKMMARILKNVSRKTDFRLVSINSGNMHNAIPREAEAVISIKNDCYNELILTVNKQREELILELSDIEHGFQITTEIIKNNDLPIMPANVGLNITNALCAMPDGIIRLSNKMSGTIETSTNLSLVKTCNDKVSGMCLARSFIDSARDNVATMIVSCLDMAGAKTEYEGIYPGWTPNMDSPIVAVTQTAFEKIHGYKAKTVAMHAGLECGILGATYPNWDMVSIGPTICSPHSPEERVDIASVARFWKLLVEILRTAE